MAHSPANILLIVTCIVLALASVTYFFYSNRIVGSIIARVIRLVLWSKDDPLVYIDIGSVHFSLIAGRVLFRDIRYHSSNQSFRIVKLQISWRWWIRMAIEDDADRIGLFNESDYSGRNSSWCRAHASIDGFEWFMYNRTASFDYILAQMTSDGDKVHEAASNAPPHGEGCVSDPLYSVSEGSQSPNKGFSFIDRLIGWLKGQLPNLDPKSLLPFSFVATKGAITLGNHTTENLLMAEFTRAQGTFGITQSRSKLDTHKQILHINFNGALVSCVDNPDYWTNSQSIGESVRESVVKECASDPPLSYSNFKRIWNLYRRNFPFFKQRGDRYIKTDKSSKRKERQKKPAEESSHVGADFTELEYAIARRLLEAPVLDLVYYADVAGKVPEKANGEYLKESYPKTVEFMDIGNGDLPPEWGVDVVVTGGTFHYGPWADRQRAQLQRVFFPHGYQNGSPSGILSPGEQRYCTCLKLLFEFRDVTTLHIPFREASKNWQWDGLVDVQRHRKQREAASLQVRIGDKSSVKYLVPMIATSDGYTANLHITLDAITVTSSLNDIILLETKLCHISSSLPSPLRWDEERNWNFDVTLEHSVLYLIRDHINMLSDLGRDWASGPPNDYNTFIPMLYGVQLSFSVFELNLYANDHNIIDRPLDKRDNVLFTLKGDVLKSNINIPSNVFRPLSTTVRFTVDGPDIALSLTLPRWNTHALSESAIEHLSDIGHISVLGITGFYKYFSETRQDCIDHLKLDTKIISPALKAFGWVVRHAMVLRDNYFGSFTQYSTTQEYLSKKEKKMSIGDPLDLKYRPGKNNVFQFDLSLFIEDATAVLPACVMGYEGDHNTKDLSSKTMDIGPCMVLKTSEIQLQLRLHDYCMDLSINLDPLSISMEKTCLSILSLGHKFSPSKRRLAISDFAITANRLFGPQPHTAVYVCLWNIISGDVKGSLTASEIQQLISTAKAFSHGFSDPFNVPAPEFLGIIERDATFLKVGINRVDLSLETKSTLSKLSLRQGVLLQYNNLSAMNYRKVTSISVPEIELQLLLMPSFKKQWLEIARMQTCLFADLYKAPKDWHKESQEQKKFITEQDSLTHRFTLLSGTSNNSAGNNWRNILYLQDINVPQLRTSTAKKFSPISPRSIQKSILLRAIESDSEEEHIFSEIDRDERLAASRPNSFATHPGNKDMEDGQSSSPFDESDETDTVDSEDSWSDFLEIDRTSIDPRVPYWFLCRKYDVKRSSSGFDQYMLVSGNASSSFHSKLFKKQNSRVLSEQIPDNTLADSNELVSSLPDDINRAFTRLTIPSFTFFTTPLYTVLLKDLIEDYSDEERTPESQIDTLILEWISTSVGAGSISTFDLQLHSFQLSVIQEVANLATLETLPEEQYRSNYHVATMNLELENVQSIVSIPPYNKDGASTPSLLCGKFSSGNVQFSVNSLSFHPIVHKQRLPEPSTSFTFHTKDFFSAFANLKGHIAYDNVEIQLHPFAPEVLITFAGALKQTVEDTRIVKTYTKLSAQRRRQLVFSILEHTNDILLKDLLSSVQPAFFVQSGRPNHLRQDRNWKLLFHLRHSLAEITDEQYDALKQDLKHVIEEKDMLNSLESRFVPWLLEDKLPILEVELLRSLFLTKTNEPDQLWKKHNDRPMRSCSLQAGSTRIVIIGKDSSSPSTVTLKDLEFRIDLLSRRLIFELETMAPHTSTNRCFKAAEDYVDYGTFQVVTSLSATNFHVSVFPSIIEFLQHTIHVSRILLSSDEHDHEQSSQKTAVGDFFENRTVIFEAHILLHHLLVEVAAENLVFEVASQELSSWNAIHLTKPTKPPPEYDISFNHTAVFNEFSVKARARGLDDSDHKVKDTLAGITFTNGALSLSMQNHTPLGVITRTTILLQDVEFAVPRSALRLYNFFEQWRRDYFHGIDAMVRSLYAEINQTPSRTPRKALPPAQSQEIIFDFNLSVTNFKVRLQVMHGTWLYWRVRDLVAYTKNKGSGVRTCGLQIGGQDIQIEAETTRNQNQRASKIVLDLPTVTATGSIGSKRNSLLLLVGFLHITIKPSHWDALLSVQQKFGQDFNDLLLLLGESRNSKPNKDTGKKTPKADRLIPYVVTTKFEGFKIGLEGLASTQYLECTDIDAMISNKPSPYWQFTLRDLALYLAPGSNVKQERSKPDYKQIPMYITVDLHITTLPPGLDVSYGRLEMNITKFHAVLQAHLIGDIGDFIDYLQSELILRREQRAAELEEFKEKARKFMQTFNVNPRKATLEKQSTFLGSYTLAFKMANFGAAFPLDLLERPRLRSPDSLEDQSTKAFLLTIRLVEFESQRGVSGQAHMKDFCFQFVPRFNPSNQDDFSSKRHATLNQMIYPEMTARVRTTTTSSLRHIAARADISGFVLDLEPSITAYTFSLIDAYHYGKQNVERFALGLPRPSPSSELPVLGPELNQHEQRNKLSTSVDASLNFMSGTVRMHPMAGFRNHHSTSSSIWSEKNYRGITSDAELFNLPELTVFMEYCTRSCPSSSSDERIPVLVFRSIIHSSRNTLRPSLLLFISSIVHNVEERMKRPPPFQDLTRSPSKMRHSVSGLSLDGSEFSIIKPSDRHTSNLQLFISLRIDKSRLELTCKPDVNVVAGINWESGGFILNLGPEGKGATISASIEGLTIGLKHGFLSEDSAHIDARNLNFSVNFSKSTLDLGRFINFVSVVVDTEFSGKVRFSRLQDFLCFKAVWLDHIPVLSGDAEIATSPSSKLSVGPNPEQGSKQGFDTAVIVRIRRISLEADMGQSISIVTFELHTAVVRLRLTPTYSELAFLFDSVDLQARGNLSGYLRMPDFMFRTMRRRHGPHAENQPFNRMLELNLTSGTLDIQLQSDWLWLLQYRAEPLKAAIYDHWTEPSHSEIIKDRQLQLYSEISGSKVIAMMTIMAIPKLMMYAAKFRANMEAQKEGASRESSAFRSTRLPRPDNVLSDVASAMLQTARTKLKETESLSYIIGQHMSLNLKELVFVVLPRSQGDNEIARFIVKDVTAKLERTVLQDKLTAHRDLQLSLSRISISQLLKQGFDPRSPGHEFDILTTSTRRFTGTENVIFSLPAMDMRMITDEEIRDGQQILPYDFISSFVRAEGQKGEDINISFNISLYSWLTSLRKTFTKELRRAQEVSEGKGPISPQTATFPRLASPDMPASLTDALSSDRSQSPSESLPSSQSPSKSPNFPLSQPSSPVTSRSMESIVITTPSKPLATRPPSLLSPKTELSESVKSINASLNPPVMQSSSSSNEATATVESSSRKTQEITYVVRTRKIEKLTVKQLGEATPDVMHPFFTRKAGFNLEESLPQYVHEYATLPIEEIMQALVKLYSKQLN